METLLSNIKLSDFGINIRLLGQCSEAGSWNQKFSEFSEMF